jgi:hypothetical protein
LFLVVSLDEMIDPEANENRQEAKKKIVSSTSFVLLCFFWGRPHSFFVVSGTTARCDRNAVAAGKPSDKECHFGLSVCYTYTMLAKST